MCNIIHTCTHMFACACASFYITAYVQIPVSIMPHVATWTSTRHLDVYESICHRLAVSEGETSGASLNASSAASGVRVPPGASYT